MSLSGETLVKA